jgi:tyrosyl-DNA phosphodiesterase-1
MDKLIDLTSESEIDNQSFSFSHSYHKYSSNTKWSPFYLLKSNSILSEHNRQSLSFGDIFQGNFEFAILSNYMVDLSFIFSECGRFLCPGVITLILHGSKSSEEALKSQLENMGLPNVFISLVEVSEAFGTHHCKYALLFYESGVRVVITTANYLDHDFYDMTQGVYVQDFPLLLDKSHTKLDEKNFKKDLLSFLHQAKIKEPFCRQLFRDQFQRFDSYDFSLAEVEIVASVPGISIKKNYKKKVLNLC